MFGQSIKYYISCLSITEGADSIVALKAPLPFPLGSLEAGFPEIGARYRSY
jgi:hypothetical protein